MAAASPRAGPQGTDTVAPNDLPCGWSTEVTCRARYVEPELASAGGVTAANSSRMLLEFCSGHEGYGGISPLCAGHGR